MLLENMNPPQPLWATFSQLWSSTFGVPAQAFEFTAGKTFMASPVQALGGIALYYAVIFGGRWMMTDRPAFQLKIPFIIHNFYLTMISAGLLALFLEQIIPTLWNNGTYCAVCEKAPGGWTKPLEVLYYLNYLTKYLEFVDTLFLVAKKKPLTFLHTYHHGATAFLCFMQLQGQTPVSWVPIVLNLMVHTVMYWYYFQAARGIKIWWKKYITVMQIAQFVLDLGFIYFASYHLFASRRLPQLPHVGPCAGSGAAASTGVIILTSYLFLFIGFYTTNYKPTQKRPIAKFARALSEKDTHGRQTGKTSAVDPFMSKANQALKHIGGRRVYVSEGI